MSGFSPSKFQFLLAAGQPNASGILHVYGTGTTTNYAIYTDGGLTTPQANPITLDANGECKFYYDGASNLRLDSYDVNNSFLETIDPVFPVGNPITQTGVVTYKSASFTLDSTNNGQNIIATQAITITLPLTTTLSNTYQVGLNAQGGAITLTPNAADKINGGTAGTSLVIPQGSSALLITDAAGNWYLNYYSSVINVTSINGGQLAGFRNVILNGNMAISQRRLTTALAGNAGYQYTTDRWAFSGTTNSTAFQGTASTQAGLPNYLRVQRTAAAVDVTLNAVLQSATSANSVPFQGKQVTLSFYARAGANYSPTASAFVSSVFTGTGTDQSAASMGAGTWTGNAQQSQTNTLTTSWQRFTQTVTLSGALNQIGVYFSATPVGTAGANDYFDITGVQLEGGSIATPFENRQQEVELTMCKPYCQVYRPTSATQEFISSGQASSTTTVNMVYVLDGVMRSSPALTVSNATHFGITSNAFANIALTALTLGFTGKKSVLLNATIAAGQTAGNSTQIYSNNASALLTFDAEL